MHNKKQKNHKVHRLVAEAFIPNPENKPQVNHISGRKDDNTVCNLEWATQSENMKHAFKNGLSKALKGEDHVLSKKVKQYDKEGNLIKIWESQSEAGKQLNINQASISSCCRKQRKQAGGYIWRYKENN